MALKMMLFMDGCWFYRNRQTLFDASGEEGFEIDYKNLPTLLRDSVAESLDLDVDLVRTCYFGTLPVNKPGYNPQKQRSFYEFLGQQCGYDTEIAEIDLRVDAPGADERSVGVALASSAMFYAMLPGVFDIACVVGSGFEYRALLRRLRQLGKRTQLVTMHDGEERLSANAAAMFEPGLLDFPPVFLDDRVSDIRLVRKPQTRVCKICGAEETTTWAGAEFFCSKCRSGHNRRVRVCDTCGAEEETTWDKSYFYCSACRRKHREDRLSRQDSAAAVTPIV